MKNASVWFEALIFVILLYKVFSWLVGWLAGWLTHFAVKRVLKRSWIVLLIFSVSSTLKLPMRLS